MIHVVAIITAKPGKRAEILGHFRANVPTVRAEKGCIEYGATVDAEDCLWVTHWGHGHLKRYDPTGALMTSIQMPVTNITCPAFGGRNLDVIYVTSATFRLTPEQKAQQPLAGGLFAVHAGVKGVVEKRYRG